MVCPRFSERFARLLALLALLACACAPACATVKPQDRELLADPAMVYAGDGPSRHEQHVLENREAARGTSGSGGGCGCN